VFFCCQAAAKIMLAGEGGHIVNISSLGALKPWEEHAHYCASKAGVVMLTRALAKAWAPHISVNTVAPGVIPFHRIDARVERFIAATPAKRAGTGEEIAEAVLNFLRSSRFTTGQLVAVDGGLGLK
jgi:NAD(P)-dependent dehydrogenase (short-subunit alcohol dehydrogenase family)